jgi:hypothetical protein
VTGGYWGEQSPRERRGFFELDRRITEQEAELDAHEAAEDPHPQYITDVEALASAAEVQGNLDDHEAATTDVHGIADTALLETQAGATSKVALHAAEADPHTQYVKAAGDMMTGTLGITKGVAFGQPLAASLRLTYDGTDTYGHDITTQHHSSITDENFIHFRLWQVGDSASAGTVPSNNVLTLRGTRIVANKHVELDAGAPTAINHATRKDYVDTADGLRVLKSGDTMTGGLTTPSLSALAIYGTDLNASLSMNGNWMPYLDGSNYFNGGSHIFRSLDGLTTLGTLDGSGNLGLLGYLTATEVGVSAAAPTAANHLTRKDYVDGLITAHTGDTTDAHDASAISVTPFGFLTSTNMQDALSEFEAEIEGRIVEGDVDAILDALNNGTPSGAAEITRAGIIVSDAIASGAVVAAKISANAIETTKLAANVVTTAKLATDAIKSTNYDGPDGGEVFADAGSFFDLANGNITSTGLVLDGTSGALSIKGSVDATAFKLLDGGTTVAELTSSPSSIPFSFPESGLVMSTASAIGSTQMSWGSTTGPNRNQFAIFTSNPAAANDPEVLMTSLVADGSSSQWRARVGYSGLGGYADYNAYSEDTDQFVSLSFAGDGTTYGYVRSRGGTGGAYAGDVELGAKDNVGIRVNGVQTFKAYSNYVVPGIDGGNSRIYVGYLPNFPANYCGLESVTGSGYLLVSNAYDPDTYLNGAGSLQLRSGGVNRVTLNGSHLYSSVRGRFLNNGGSDYSLGQVIADPGSVGGSTAQLVLHPGAIANQFRNGYADSNTYLRNSNDTGYPALYCDVVDTSSGRYKEDVKPASVERGRVNAMRGKGPETALDRVRKLRPVHFRWKKEQRLRHTDGHVHTCGVDCPADFHSPENPCSIYRQWEAGQVGFIAEELHEVFPEATEPNVYTGEVEGIKTLAVVALLTESLQELAAEVDRLKGRP